MRYPMIRRTLLSATLLVSFAVPVLAQDAAKDALCRQEGQIATNIMTERKNGSNANRAERRVIRNLPEDARNYAPAVPALVQWIYGLPIEQMTPAVSNALYRNCLSR